MDQLIFLHTSVYCIMCYIACYSEASDTTRIHDTCVPEVYFVITILDIVDDVTDTSSWSLGLANLWKVIHLQSKYLWSQISEVQAASAEVINFKAQAIAEVLRASQL